MKYLCEDINLGNTNSVPVKRIKDTKINFFLRSLDVEDKDIFSINIREYTHVNDLHVEIQIFYKG